MKISKRFLSLFVSLVLVISTMAVATISVSADSNFPALDTSKANVKIDTVSVTTAGTVTVPIRIAKNPGIWGANFQVAFDSALTFDKDATQAQNPGGCILNGAALFSEPKNNVITAYIENSDLSNAKSDGIIVKLVFKLATAKVGSTYPVSFTYVDRKSFINAEASDLSLTFGDGGVKVVAPLATPATAKISSVVLTNKSTAKITWGRATNANKFDIYRKVGSGSYYKIKSGVTSTSYTNTGLAAGKTYYYIVKSYNNTKPGANSAAKSITTLSTKKPSKVSLKAGKKSFTATRKGSITGATGYQIQYGLKSNFKGAKTKTINSKVTIKSLKAKKNYYVRIRAVKKSGCTLYGSWSSTSKIKTK